MSGFDSRGSSPGVDPPKVTISAGGSYSQGKPTGGNALAGQKPRRPRRPVKPARKPAKPARRSPAPSYADQARAQIQARQPAGPPVDPNDPYAAFANHDAVKAAMDAEYGPQFRNAEAQIRQGEAQKGTIDAVMGEYIRKLNEARGTLGANYDKSITQVGDQLAKGAAAVHAPSLDPSTGQPIVAGDAVQAQVNAASQGAVDRNGAVATQLAGQKASDDTYQTSLAAIMGGLTQQMQAQRESYVHGLQDDLTGLQSERGAKAFTLDQQLTTGARDYADSRADKASENELAIQTLLQGNVKSMRDYRAAMATIKANRDRAQLVHQDNQAGIDAKVNMNTADNTSAEAIARANRASREAIAKWANTTSLKAAAIKGKKSAKGGGVYQSGDGTAVDLTPSEAHRWRQQSAQYKAIIQDALNALEPDAQASGKGNTTAERAIYHLKRSYSNIPTQVLRAAIYAAGNNGKVDGRYAQALQGWFTGALVPQSFVR